MLLAISILVRVTLSDGSVIQCQTSEPVMYSLDARTVEVVGCGDGLFSDSFEVNHE